MGLALGIGLVAWCLPNPALAQPVALTLESVGPDGARLRAAGSTAAQVSLEGSFNLQDCFQIQSVATANGTAEFLHASPVPASAVCYRAREGAQPNLVNRRRTPSVGGRAESPDVRPLEPDGSASADQAPAAAVREPVAVRMTVITNFSAFPEHDGFRAAVAFEPEGFDFQPDFQLTISFPADLPVPDMAGYSFDGDGTGFHLIAARPSSREVVLSVDHFSGKVAISGEQARHSFDQPGTASQDAGMRRRTATPTRSRQILRDEYSGKISENQAKLAWDLSELDMVFDVYRSSVQPTSRSRRLTTPSGRVVWWSLRRLQRLIAVQSRVLGGPPGEYDPLGDALRSVMPKVRCACARALIRECEQNPNASGSRLLAALNDLLLDSRLVTGRTDAQGCELGSDDQIRERLMSGPCFGDWEGTIVLSRVESVMGTTQNGARTGTWDNETRELYSATVKRVVRHRTFTSGGKPAESWELETDGVYHAGVRISRQLVDDPPNWEVVTTTTDTASAADSFPTTGDIHVRLVNGQLESLGAGGGGSPLSLRYSVLTETAYRCKVPFPPNNPCPTGSSWSQNRSLSLFQGYGVDATDPEAAFTSVPGRITATWYRVREFEKFSEPPERVEERIQMTLVKKPNR
ncbi:MAG: hypothetical protein HS113_20035 [Verrucomicrobiales bacterium]|nr:hypothetical protein [Verrucomicrobiales bacterium]